MKTRNSIFALLLLSGILFISSCQDDRCDLIQCENGGICDNGTCLCPTGYTGITCETLKDLSLNIVGTYNGKVNDAGTVYDNQRVSVEKISDTRIQINGLTDYVSVFYADLSKTPSGIVLTIPQQSDNSGNYLIGNALIASSPNAHGSYEDATGKFSYSLLIHYSGVNYYETFQGIK